MNHVLRTLPNFDGLFGAEMGGLRRDAALAQVLDQFWPECFESTHGGVVMKPEDASRMERLFELFGVPLRVGENSLKTVGYAYDVFCVALEPFVSDKLREPDQFRTWVDDWPADWVAYIEAVAAADTKTARRLAVKLQVLSPDCQFPPRVHVPQDDAPKPPK